MNLLDNNSHCQEKENFMPNLSADRAVKNQGCSKDKEKKNTEKLCTVHTGIILQTIHVSEPLSNGNFIDI